MEKEYIFFRETQVHNQFVIILVKFLVTAITFAVAPVDYCLKALGRRGFSYTEERLSLDEDEGAGGYVERTRTINVFSFSGALSRKSAYQPRLPGTAERVIRNASFFEHNRDQ